MSDIDLPVLVEGDLKVRCEYSGCNATTTVNPTVDAKQSADSGDRWAITFVPNAAGTLEVDSAQCPKHRITNAIDDAVAAQQQFGEEFAKTMNVVEKLNEA